MNYTHDCLAYGYDEFYLNYITAPHIQGLLELAPAQLIKPCDFDAHNPHHVCLSAVHGFMIYPPDKQFIKERVRKDDAPYSKTVSARIEAFKALVSRFNAEEQRMRPFSGAAFILKIEDEPFTLEEFKLYGLEETWIAKAALEFEADRAYFNKDTGHAGRLNHFARHHGFSNFKALMLFIDRLDDEARKLGYESYASICISKRYVDDMIVEYEKKEDLLPIANEMSQKKDLLKQESVFTIECFIKCRVSGDNAPYFVDVTDEGVKTNIYEGRVTDQFISTSKFLSDKNDDFHAGRDWFVSSEDAL